MAFAKRLVRALADLEEYDGDPLNVFDDAKVTATQYKVEVGKLVEHLERYYTGMQEDLDGDSV